VICLLLWQRVIVNMCVLSVGVTAFSNFGFVYCVVVCQLDVSMLLVLCGGLLAFYTHFVCAVWWCASMSYVWLCTV